MGFRGFERQDVLKNSTSLLQKRLFPTVRCKNDLEMLILFLFLNFFRNFLYCLITEPNVFPSELKAQTLQGGAWFPASKWEGRKLLTEQLIRLLTPPLTCLLLLQDILPSAADAVL